MRPAFSVVFLTTLCGAAQGLLLTLVIVEALARAAGVDIAAPFYVTGAALSVALGALGLLASFFHLGHPERARARSRCGVRRGCHANASRCRCFSRARSRMARRTCSAGPARC